MPPLRKRQSGGPLDVLRFFDEEAEESQAEEVPEGEEEEEEGDFIDDEEEEEEDEEDPHEQEDEEDENHLEISDESEDEAPCPVDQCKYELAEKLGPCSLCKQRCCNRCFESGYASVVGLKLKKRKYGPAETEILQFGVKDRSNAIYKHLESLLSTTSIKTSIEKLQDSAKLICFPCSEMLTKMAVNNVAKSAKEINDIFGI
jgi:hypothetical protein